MHPFSETDALLRDLAALERRIGGKWADTAKIRRWTIEATELTRLAGIDRRNGNPNGDPA